MSEDNETTPAIRTLTDDELDLPSGGVRNATLPPDGGGTGGPGGFFEGATVSVWLAGVRIL